MCTSTECVCGVYGLCLCVWACALVCMKIDINQNVGHLSLSLYILSLWRDLSPWSRSSLFCLDCQKVPRIWLWLFPLLNLDMLGFYVGAGDLSSVSSVTESDLTYQPVFQSHWQDLSIHLYYLILWVHSNWKVIQILSRRTQLTMIVSLHCENTLKKNLKSCLYWYKKPWNFACIFYPLILLKNYQKAVFILKIPGQ